MDFHEAASRAAAFLGGESLSLKEADEVWTTLLEANDVSRARATLARLREPGSVIDSHRFSGALRKERCRKEAELTSKDQEIHAAVRHDLALELLREAFDIDEPTWDGDAETLGVAGGIAKRRWMDLGQLADLKRAAGYYERGAAKGLGVDGYTAINAAFIEDLLAAAGDEPHARRLKAQALRERVANDLAPRDHDWFNVASRVEALFGLGRYVEATAVVRTAPPRAAWKLESTARQLATIAHLRERNPYANPEINAFFEALVPGMAAAVRSAMLGKVGLALSGGGFRASFFHLGVLARLAELDVLRHIDVLSCVSGGSIVGTCYYLKVLAGMKANLPLSRSDYLTLVQDLIRHFEDAVATDVRGHVQPGMLGAFRRFVLEDEKGAIDSLAVAEALEKYFYRPLMPGKQTLQMSDLKFDPPDHDLAKFGGLPFNPGRHNWMRVDKVPALVLNATTVNTGHGWQFTPTWMGESPWSSYEAADSVPRLEWAYYDEGANWTSRLGRAVAASACVPGIFSPIRIDDAYEGLEVQLVDGGVCDNQGTAALLAMSCNVLIVSDAAGQLLLEKKPAPGPRGLISFALRTQDTLMERIRGANHSDLGARRRSGLLRGLMTVHMKAGLDADPIRLNFSQQSHTLQRTPLSPSGVRRDFQQAVAELRTDLNAFTPDESRALMACGYQMATKSFERDLAELVDLAVDGTRVSWVFDEMRAEVTSTAASTPRRQSLLAALRQGSRVER
jgi:predicted acylesterase/phospholipase RssA